MASNRNGAGSLFLIESGSIKVMEKVWSNKKRCAVVYGLYIELWSVATCIYNKMKSFKEQYNRK